MQSTDAALDRPGEFRRGWPVVLACTVGIALGLSPIPFYEIGLFAPAMSREFGWGTGQIMAGVFFMMCGSMVAGPVAGLLADRHGARRVALVSIVCFGASVGMFSLQKGSLPLFYANWFVMAVTGAGTLPITWTRSINEHFDLKKGLALGLALAGTGLSGLLIKPITGAVIGTQGWRAGWLVLGSLPLLVSFPLAALCLRRRPAAQNVVPRSHAAPDVAAGLSFGEAIRDGRFWLVGVGIVPVAFAIGGPIANLEGILRSHGVARGTIGHVVPFIGAAVIVGRLGGGWLLDRVWAPAVGFGLFTLSSAASWTLVSGPPTAAAALVGIVGLGLAAGLEFDLMSFLTARYFGARSYGAIYGTLYAFFGLGSGISPLVYGRAFDRTGSFAAVVGGGAAAMLLGGVLLLGLGRYRFHAADSSLGPRAADPLPREPVVS